MSRLRIKEGSGLVLQREVLVAGLVVELECKSSAFGDAYALLSDHV